MAMSKKRKQANQAYRERVAKQGGVHPRRDWRENVLGEYRNDPIYRDLMQGIDPQVTVTGRTRSEPEPQNIPVRGEPSPAQPVQIRRMGRGHLLMVGALLALNPTKFHNEF